MVGATARALRSVKKISQRMVVGAETACANDVYTQRSPVSPLYDMILASSNFDGLWSSFLPTYIAARHFFIKRPATELALYDAHFTDPKYLEKR